MIASEMVVGSNFIPKILSGKPPEAEKPKVMEKVVEENSQTVETVRENVDINREALEKGIEEINKNIKIFNTKISFSLDEITGTTVIKISDVETDEVIREVPPSEFLKIAARLSEIFGLIIDKKV
ncbi:flagellar protein FlaG [bacterium]|nr:flagellar protein FlaG [bacterium]